MIQNSDAHTWQGKKNIPIHPFTTVRALQTSFFFAGSYKPYVQLDTTRRVQVRCRVLLDTVTFHLQLSYIYNQCAIEVSCAIRTQLQHVCIREKVTHDMQLGRYTHPATKIPVTHVVQLRHN
jgi:hypothetical protein